MTPPGMTAMENLGPFTPLLYDQRLVERVLRHWAEMAAGQKLPRLGEIDPWMLGEDWSYCALIRLAADPAASAFITVGDRLLPGTAHPRVGMRLSTVPAETVLGQTLSHLNAALAAGTPVKVEGAAEDKEAVPLIYRSVLLPLSDHGETVDYVLVAANFRVQRVDERIAPYSRATVVTREPKP